MGDFNRDELDRNSAPESAVLARPQDAILREGGFINACTADRPSIGDPTGPQTNIAVVNAHSTQGEPALRMTTSTSWLRGFLTGARTLLRQIAVIPPFARAIRLGVEDFAFRMSRLTGPRFSLPLAGGVQYVGASC